MRTQKFVGTGTALVTSFKEGGIIDQGALGVFVERQITNGVDFLVPCGTTGESPTLPHHEHNQVIKLVVDKVAGRIPVLAGTGSNSTDEAMQLTLAAKDSGADGALVVMPYYNKPMRAGLMVHFRMIAKIGLPVVIYDIPGRCGGSMIPAATILELAREGTIVGLKWASGNLDQLYDVLAGRPKDFTVLSGDDNLTFPAMCLGADGVISVLSNLIPKRMKDFVAQAKLGSGWSINAMTEHFRLLPLMRAMFIETNPIPVKTALAMVYPDIFREIFRSPLAPMEGGNREKLARVLEHYNLVKEDCEKTI